MKEGALFRIKKYLDYKGISNRAFEMQFGFSNGSFASQLKKGKTIGVDRLENILNEYTDINVDWLMTGHGSMLKSAGLMDEAGIAPEDEEVRRGMRIASTHKAAKPTQQSAALRKAEQGDIPLIPISAVAGVLSGNSLPVMDYDCEHYNVPLFKGAEFLIQITGDSMQPKYYSGDIVACRRLRIDTFFQWNRSYVVDSEQGVLLKRIFPGRDDDHLKLVSDNTAYPPFELQREDIYSIALVVGVIRAE